MADIGERSLGGILYFHLARIYPSGERAKSVFDALQKEGKRRKGKLDLGVYRVMRRTETEPRVLVLVSLSRAGIEYAANVIGGERYDELPPHELDGLMARRVRVVAPIYERGEQPEGGQVVIRRGKRGAYVRPDGTMDERIGNG